MANTYRVTTALGVAVVLSAFLVALLWTPEPASGQFKQPGQPQPQPPAPKDPDKVWSAIKLVENEQYQEWITVARDCMASKPPQYKRAIPFLQNILNSDNDFYAEVTRRDPRTLEEKTRFVSVKIEANRLLSGMEKEGMNAYEVVVGGKAKDLLDDAKKKGDVKILAEVAQRYMNSKAGIEANELLATYFLDRGQFFKASLHFERLLSMREERAKLSDLVLFKATLAHRRAGDLENAKVAWTRLLKNIRNTGLKVGDEVVSVEKLQKVLDDIPVVVASNNPHDRPWVGGNLANTAQAGGSPPLLDEPLWARDTIMDRMDKDSDPDPSNAAKVWLTKALTTYRGQVNSAILPGAFPITTNGKLIYRTYAGITSVYLKEVKEGNEVIKPGDIDWKSTQFEGSLGVLLSGESKNVPPNIDNWLLNTYMSSGFINLVYENTKVGTLSTDHKLVFAVDDLAVPIPPAFLSTNVRPSADQYQEDVKPRVFWNNLQAFELDTGKLAWRLGPGFDPKTIEKNDPFFESHFLGAPLPVAGKLYALNEKNDGTLRLVCIDPGKGTVIGPVQELGKVNKEFRVLYDISRRATAIHLAYGEGILVCPTNAGHVFGVDLLTRSLAWAYPYRQGDPAPNSIVDTKFGGGSGNRTMALTYENWKTSPPLIADGKVIFTAPDAKAVHCINLRDGEKLWEHPRQDNDLFLAGVFKDQVLIVGKNSVRFLRLSDGIVLGSLATGDVPSGQGVASNNVYFLPLAKGEILAIDVPRRRATHNRSSYPVDEKHPAPGNLVFYEGSVLSQTTGQLVAYPQLTAKLDVAKAELLKDPNSLEKRYLRGWLLLADGKVQEAVDDLRTVRDKKPPQELAAKVNQKLYEALTSLLETDFDKASLKYLDEYAELCKLGASDDERQRREAGRLRIIGQGREAQGNLVEAFKAYRTFGNLPLFKQEGVPSLEDPLTKIPTVVWLRGRVNTMFSSPATKPDQRAALEKQVEQEWLQVAAKNDLEAIRTFVGMFDVPFKVGRDARLRLADVLAERKTAKDFLEAELALQQLRVGELKTDPKIGGMALEMLARLEKRKAGVEDLKQGSDEALRQSAAYYRQLADEFPKVVVRDGKTGLDLFNELSQDKRALNHLEDEAALWARTDLKHRVVPSGGIQGFQGFTLSPTGDLSPFLRQHRLILNAGNYPFNDPLLLLVNTTTNKEVWRLGLGNEPRNMNYFQYLIGQADRNAAFHPHARFRYFHAKGHLAVVQVGTVVCGIDAGAGQLLWKYNVLDATQQHPGAQIITETQNQNNDGTLWYVVNNNLGQPVVKARVGHVGAVEASYVALTTQKGLVVLDPLRGTVLWTKMSVPPQTEIFGDDQNIYLVEMTPGGQVAGPGRALRAVDGTAVEVKDFGPLFRHRLRVLGRNIVVADPSSGLTVRLYDVLTGQDLFKHHFDAGGVLCQTEDPNLVGVIDHKGVLTALDLKTRQELFKSNLLKWRITPEVIKNLHKPLLLRDAENFFVALNQSVDPRQVAGGVVSSNFNNGVRCHLVNGWFCCVDAKGEFLWHLCEEIHNQMIVVEQFRSLPVLIFSSRYVRPIQNQPVQPVGQQGVWQTAVFNKADAGWAIHWPLKTENAPNTTAAKFTSFTVDVKGGTINLIGNATVEQIYLDDGKKDGAALAPKGGGGQAPGAPAVVAPPVAPPVAAPGGGPRIRRALKQ